MTEAATEDVEFVTDADVREAERAAQGAAREAQHLEQAIATGAADVTIDQVEEAEKKSRFASLFAKGQRVKADRYQAARRAEQLRALRDEVIEIAPKTGDDLVKALKAVEKAARAFVNLADEHDERLRQWVIRAQAFNIDRGLTEQGVGLNGIEQLIVEGLVFEEVKGTLRLGGLFHNTQSGYPVPTPIRAENDPALVGTYRTLDAIGEGL